MYTPRQEKPRQEVYSGVSGKHAECQEYTRLYILHILNLLHITFIHNVINIHVVNILTCC